MELQRAEALLRKLDLTEGSANVVVNDQIEPAELIVLVFCQPKPIRSIDVWDGHPVRILFTGAPPSIQIH